jgi:transcriptional antiterminator NusG
MPKQWFVLRVQAGKEDKVKEALERKIKISGLEELVGEVLVPKKKETVQRTDGKFVEKDVKIFPGYIYIEAELYDGEELRDELYYLVKGTPSVGDFAGSVGRPAPMSTEDVERIHNRLPAGAVGISGESGTPVEVTDAGEIVSPFAVGDRIRIREGHAFGGFEGAVEEVEAQKGKVKVAVTIFGRPTEVELTFAQVQKLG